jgi:hypothetical protein
MAPSPQDLPERKKRAPARRFEPARLDEAAHAELARLLALLDGIDGTFAHLAGTPGCAAIDPARLEPVAEEIGMACEGVLDDGAPPSASATLAWNLELAARAYGDAIDVVLGTTDENDRPFNPASDYQWSGVTGETDLALVIAVAREARDCAAREGGLEERHGPRRAHPK